MHILLTMLLYFYLSGNFNSVRLPLLEYFYVMFSLSKESESFSSKVVCVCLKSFHAEEPGYSFGGRRNRHPAAGAHEAYPKTYGTISCSNTLTLDKYIF